MEDQPNWQPVQSMHEEIRVSDTCTDYKNKYTGKIDRRRWFSTADEKKIRDAILFLTITECGFKIEIKAPAFNVEGEKNKYMELAELRITRTGFGYGGLGPKDQWHVAFNADMLGTFDDPEKAVDFFMEKRAEFQVGEDMADLHFAGHVGPSRIKNAPLGEQNMLE